MSGIDSLLVLPASDFPYFSRMTSEWRTSCVRGIFMNVDSFIIRYNNSRIN